MKNWMRYCASALATLTLLAGLASCKGGKTNPADSTENGNGTESDRSEVTTDNRDENGYLLDDLGERDYNDKKIRILTWINKSYNQFSFDSENGDHSNKFEEAVYSRNLRVEQRMKVQLKWTSIEGKQLRNGQLHHPSAGALAIGGCGYLRSVQHGSRNAGAGWSAFGYERPSERESWQSVVESEYA